MNIDWSKAPKGATHWEPTSQKFVGGWMKKEGSSWFWWRNMTQTWNPSYLGDPSRLETFQPLPQKTWDGQGLPPVGTVCEAIHEDINSGKPVKAEILKHHDNGLSVAFFWVDAPVEAEGNLYWAQRFRPLRTPEQIADEQRRKDIIELANVIRDAGDGNDYVLAEALHDAGYRKKESDDD
ncbi:hypothetical protein KPP10_gp122 [Pseudomonas phage KPP10]|uniref:Uncharacterized protein n=1 Tax=Pseudomonas phage KPP10 TaxID=582345 RepID=G1UCV9_BPKPP|nr:hypothetical protein KPP10_gp122 [Pseudomonas phage KPP10]BAK78949.1 hypothetical protein [Pseudomonas phage KPP10]